MTLEATKKQVLDRCIRQLTAIKAEFAIIIEGEKYGTLEIVEAAPKRTRKADRWASVAEKVKTQIQTMKVGDVITLEPPPGETLVSFQSHVSNQAGVILGRGGDYYITSKNREKNYIELLRLQ
jgi:hypothetical protein